ncbi:MAG: sugar phosphate isomerase/epimerase [Firmicutes bacterium]|nr:sugar phosphate isomerase/epimerase [Bacillota bacterium]
MSTNIMIGCCTGIENYDLLVSCGYESICLSAAKLYEISGEEFDEYKKKISEGTLKLYDLNGFYKPGIFLNGPFFNEEKLAGYTEKICERGQALGCRYLGIGAPKARNVGKDDDPAQMLSRFKDSLRLLCGIASRYDMEILLESVCTAECNLVTTVRKAFEIVKELDLSNLGLVYDIYHDRYEGENLDIIDEAAEYIKTVHIAEDLEGKRIYLKEEYSDVYAEYWKRLERAGYRGEFSLECFVGDPVSGIKDSYKILKSIKEQIE